MLGFLTSTGGKCACRGVMCCMRSYQRTRFWYSATCPEGKFFCTSLASETTQDCRVKAADEICRLWCAVHLLRAARLSSLQAHHRAVHERGQDQVGQGGSKAGGDKGARSEPVVQLHGLQCESGACEQLCWPSRSRAPLSGAPATPARTRC